MSTLKTDAIVAVSTNGDLSLDGLGTGGVSIASTLKMTKGGDISSASPLVIDTDGNYFDVTGTTNFSAMTVESGNFFMLQFDGALTITHGSGIELPGATNLTTATGDRLMCYATAADTVEVMSVETEAGGGGFTLATEQATTSGSSITFGSIPAGVTMIIINVEDMSTTATTNVEVQLGDAGGIETSGYDGSWLLVQVTAQQTQTFGTGFQFIDTAQSEANDRTHMQMVLTLKDAANFTWQCGFTLGTGQQSSVATGSGAKSLSAELTQIKIITVGTFDAGSVNIMYQ